MESPTPAPYIPQNSERRVPEVVEMSPPISRTSSSKSLVQKQGLSNDVIGIDMEEEDNDALPTDEFVESNNKGKEILVDLSLCPSGGTTSALQDQTSETNCPPGSYNLLTMKDFSSDESYGDNELIDMYDDDLFDDYAIWNSYSDVPDLPPVDDVPFWLPGPVREKMVSTSKSPQSHMKTFNVSSKKGTSHSWQSVELSKPRDKSNPSSGSAFGDQSWKLEPPFSFLEPASGEKRSDATNSSTDPNSAKPDSVKSPPQEQPYSTVVFLESSQSKTPYDINVPYNQFNPWAFSSPSTKASPMAFWGNFPPNTSNNSTTIPPTSPGHVHGFGPGAFPSPAFGSWYPNPVENFVYPTTVGFSSIAPPSPYSDAQFGNIDEILERFSVFKKFDTVQDHSDHHFSKNASQDSTAPKGWAKRIQEEWKILEKDLPDTIFVRVYESRMDLLRAVIVGVDGTPYHDGLFFFDVLFPSGYPDVPPQVHYYSGGLRINPNLYQCGKVCLSLLNTWSGHGNEKWIPGESTMLQVLVSIQGLILNAKPFFNEPGFEQLRGRAKGEQRSLRYSENTYLSNLRTMVYSIRRPPKHFEDFVAGHFFNRALDILAACKAYIDGAQVGSLVKGGIQDVDEGDKSCSQNFRNSVAGFIKTVIDSFTKVGAKDCDKFLYLAEKRATGPDKPSRQNEFGPHNGV